MIEQLLSPRRVAIIGSLSKASGVGTRTLRHLQDSGFPGELLPVGTASELAGDVDLAVVAVPASAVPAVLSELDGRAGYVVVFSSGFDEAGADALVASPRTRILGPNTVGFYYAPSRAMVTFAVAFDDMTDCRHGSGVVLLSQSGAFGARLIRSARRHGLDYDGFIGTGNENDLSVVSLGRALVASPTHRPRVLALYLESVRDGLGLEHLLRDARDAGVRPVLLLGGVSRSGAEAARSHTAAVSPDHAVVAELCALHGAVQVYSDRELVEATIGLSVAGPARGARIGVITGSGGAGVVAADLLAGWGRPLHPLSSQAQRSLEKLLPGYASAANPVDVTAQVIGDTEAVARVRGALVDSGEVDAVLVIGRVDQAPAICAEARVPVVLAVLDGDATSVAGAIQDGQAVLPSLAAACTAVVATTVTAGTMTVHSGLLGAPYRADDAISSLRFVADAGVAVAPWRSAGDPAAVVAGGDELGWPVVLKANLPAQAHKAAAGGIRLDVYRDGAEVAAAALLELAPALVVARQLRAGPELFVGVRRDPLFGLVVVAGLGGGHVELIARTVTVPATADAAWLADRLRERVFGHAGPRYHHLPDLLAATAANLVDLANRHHLDLVECNPLVEVDNHLIALDARVMAT